MNSLMDSEPQIETNTGEIKAKITYDYILDLYQELDQQQLTEQEYKSRVAVLKVLADHVGEYIIIKHK